MLGKRTRKQQITTLSILAVAVIVLSVGFAAFSTTLNIQSQASVNPDAGNFSVKFSSDGTSVANTQTVAPSSTTYGDSATIDNSLQNPTIKGLNAKFTKPGQSVSYTFYAKNTGEYLAYLTTILFNNVSGESSNKVCTAGTDSNGVTTTDSLVQSACNGISVSIKVGSDSAVTETTTVTNHTLATNGKEPIVVTISYGSTAAVADGPFTVSFGDISLVYSSVGSSTGSGGSPSTPEYICELATTGTATGVQLLENGTSKTTGAQYICHLDEDRTFYVLGENASDSNKIDLIMDRNYIDGTVPTTMKWCASGDDSSCNHDNLDPYIEHIQEVFRNRVEVSLPTYDQIYKAAGNKDSGLPQWLWENLNSDSNPSLAYGYWTSDSSDSYALTVNSGGILSANNVSNSTSHGLRPVITISKSDMD